MHKIPLKKYTRRHCRQNKHEHDEKENIPPPPSRSSKKRKMIVPLPKKQKIIKSIYTASLPFQGKKLILFDSIIGETVTLFAGKGIPIGISSFDQMVNRDYTLLDKTLLIADFLEYCRRELFKDTKVTERLDLFDEHFCKYPVIHISFKNYDDCKNWEMMRTQLHEELIRLYQEHRYIYKSLVDYDRERFNNILTKDKYTMTNLLKYSLFDLSRWLNNYHCRRCIILIDEYDHPLDIAHRYQYYEEARGFFASMLGMVLKDNDENLERALLVGISRTAKSGFLSELNNVRVFPMHEEAYADKFGFTEDEVSVIIQHHNLENHLEEIKQWYGGYEAGNCIHLCNPWSINSFINEKAFKAYWIDTGGTATIKKLLWRSSESIQDQVAELFLKGAIKVSIMDDIDYELLSSRFAYQALWTLLYYAGYLTMDRNKVLRIPNKEVEMEWHGWLQVKCQCSYSVDSMLDMLLRGDLVKFGEYLPNMIMEMLSFFDVSNNQAEFGYHLFMVGLLAQVQFRGYRLTSNREEGIGRFDLKIEPAGDVEFETSVIMEFKVLKKDKNKDVFELLQENSKNGLDQILEKKYRSGISTKSKKLVECGIAFHGKQTCVLSRILYKKGNQWVESQ